MNSLARRLFVGPAVVVDDEVDNENSTAHTIVKELEEAHFPVLRKRAIPPDEEVVHWQAMSLIVLDWDLRGSMNSKDDDGLKADSSLLGVVFPDSVGDRRTNSLRFVKKLMADLYCPIYIVSNLDVCEIWNQLGEGIGEDELQQLKARILVKSKTQVVRSKTQDKGSLLKELSDWIEEHPAIYALKTWERGNERAKAELFRDFQQTTVEWPGILWRNSSEDGVNPNYDLAETISRNLLHRLDPYIFEAKFILSSSDSECLDSARNVLHQQAVLLDKRLHADVIMPGDFFFEKDDDIQPQQHIDICITPACDLVARGATMTDDIRMLIVQASLVSDDELKSERSIKKLLDSSESITSVLLHHLVSNDAVYRVNFKDWDVKKWRNVKNIRRGRLLDPYVTLLQQRFALYSQRQGVPRLPKGFYKPRTE